MVDKDPQLCALNIGELDIFVDSMEPSRIEAIGKERYFLKQWLNYAFALRMFNFVFITL